MRTGAGSVSSRPARSWGFPCRRITSRRTRGDPSARETRDDVLKEKIMEVWKGEKGREVYGARKVWLELNRQGVVVARCTVERLMRELGIGGARARRKRPRTTVPGGSAGYPATCWSAVSTHRRRTRAVADITYVDTFSGWAYTAFVMDLFARRILGWQVADHLRSDLALDALEMAIWVRRHESIGGLVHHSDRGVQYTSIRYTERLEEAKAVRRSGARVIRMTMPPRNH